MKTFKRVAIALAVCCLLLSGCSEEKPPENLGTKAQFTDVPKPREKTYLEEMNDNEAYWRKEKAKFQTHLDDLAFKRYRSQLTGLLDLAEAWHSQIHDRCYAEKISGANQQLTCTLAYNSCVVVLAQPNRMLDDLPGTSEKGLAQITDEWNGKLPNRLRKASTTVDIYLSDRMYSEKYRVDPREAQQLVADAIQWNQQVQVDESNGNVVGAWLSNLNSDARLDKLNWMLASFRTDIVSKSAPGLQ